MAGVASNVVSVNQQPQYGDQKQLADMKTTTTPMSGAVIPAPTAGRPPGPAGPQAQPSEAGQPAAIPPEHHSAMADLAQAQRTREFWNNVLQQYPSEWSRMYAADANRAYMQAAATLREQTPFFDGA